MRWSSAIATLGCFVACMAFTCGCSSDKSNGPGNGGQPSDLSVLEIELFEFTAFHDDGVHDAGLSFNWRLAFSSTTGRDCRIRRYELTTEPGNALYLDDDPGPWLIRNGHGLTGKVVWLPIDAPTSEGNYTFLVAYETGQMVEQPNGETVWVGPYSDSTASYDFSVIIPTGLD